MQDKNINLILNASEGILQIVVGEISEEGNKVLVNQEWDCPQNSTEKLTPLIKDIFQKLDIPLNSIARIACVIGAGSFTGIRLSLCTAAGLSRIIQAKQVAIDFLQALAFNAPTQENTYTCVITHAKRNLVHCAEFISNEKNIPIQISPTRLIEPENLLNEIKSSVQLPERIPDFILGSGVFKYSHIFTQESIKTCIMSKHANILNPFVLLDLSQNLEVSEKDISPEYVRACDAVDNLNHISKKLGNNTTAAFNLYNTLIQ